MRIYLAGPINGVAPERLNGRAKLWRELLPGFDVVVPPDYRAVLASGARSPADVWREDIEAIKGAHAVLADLTGMAVGVECIGTIAEMSAARVLGRRVVVAMWNHGQGAAPRLHPFVAGPAEAVFYSRGEAAAYCAREFIVEHGK